VRVAFKKGRVGAQVFGNLVFGELHVYSSRVKR
jgi:hypothetical protein